MLDDIFYLENRTENARSSWALPEGTKLGYSRVTDGWEKRKSNDKYTTVKARFETRSIATDITNPARCLHPHCN